MDFNKVFEQMFNNQNNSSGGTNFNPMQYADVLKGLGSGAGNGIWLILLLLLLCFCGCGGFGGFGNSGGSSCCNNQCYEVCCRRKNRCCKKFKNYECYLNPCACNNCCNNSGGCGCSWIWVIILIVLFCGFRKGGTPKSSSSGRASNIINVDTAE
ncbi:hypothetical protein ACER0A_008385 [Haloimpatiens sp. FM7315]|uniref:hypothetical protein n=1 Tax=Haloimpatiens sp. FM7315 TaxID=3298609 RepID=UPI0035A2E58B